MKTSDLTEKNEQELAELERTLRADLFRLRMKHYSGQLQRVSQLRELRRDIARIKTVQSQRRG